MNADVILLVVILYFNIFNNHGIIAHEYDGDQHQYGKAAKHVIEHDGHRHYHSSGLRSSSRTTLIDMSSNNQSFASEYRRLNSDTFETCGSRNPTSTEFKAASKVVTKWITNQLLDLRQFELLYLA